MFKIFSPTNFNSFLLFGSIKSQASQNGTPGTQTCYQMIEVESFKHIFVIHGIL